MEGDAGSRHSGLSADHPLRIAFISHYALPHLGGIEVVIDQLARAMTARGHSVVHVAADSTREGEHAEAEPPYEVVRVPAWNPTEMRWGVPYPLFLPPQLRKALRAATARADVVHAHGLLYQSSSAAMLQSQRAGIAARVVTEHVGHVPYDSAIIEKIERLALRTVGRRTAVRARAVITLNPVVSGQIKEIVPDARIVEIPNGVDTNRYRPASPRERAHLREELGWDERPRILFVGRLVEKKGIRFVVELARLVGNEMAFVVAGPGAPVEAPANVQFLGVTPRERVAELYRAADLFLLPSRGEGFPLTAQEAMASALPVILGDDPAYCSTLAGAGAGARVAPLSAAELLRAVRELLPIRERAAADAAEFAMRNFAWEHTVESHLRLYRELIGAGRGSAAA